MQKLGQEIDRDEIQEMIKKHDIKGDNVLSYDEFKQIFIDKDDEDDDEDESDEDEKDIGNETNNDNNI